MVEIAEIVPGSIADELDLKAGDKIISINDNPVRDIIDLEYETADNYFVITVKKKKENCLWEIEIERDFGEELGIKPDKIIYDRLKYCNNKCIFCFVDQQPAGLRKSLNIKDDDYRFSFLQGSYITLSNLSDEEFSRIIEYKLSPLYISVHTTNPALRSEMMQNEDAGKIMEQLRLLAENGIMFNTQVVLCPGINDGTELDRTIKDIMTLYPAVNSLGVVPVGLTKYRENLAEIKSYNKQSAQLLLKQIVKWQKLIKEKYSHNWLYAADEFYLLADEKIPVSEHYNDFPQLENGIGLTRKLWTGFDNIKSQLPTEVNEKRIGIITGELGKKALLPVIKEMNLVRGLILDIISVTNTFYGRKVTVTGLLTAMDIKKKLQNYNLANNIIIPDIVINEDGYFIDGKTINWLKEELPCKNISICSNLNDLLEVIVDE